MNRIQFAAHTNNPPQFKRDDLCYVSGPNFFAAIKEKKLNTYSNHGRVVSFNALFNEYAIVMLGLDANKPLVTKFKASEIDPRLQRDETEWRNLDAILTRAEQFPARDQSSGL
jgi:hypothetical protein